MEDLENELNKPKLFKLEKEIGYQFDNLDLLKKALTHASFYNQKNKIEMFDFQRLEFLGDSVLNLVISDILFNKFPFFSEGELSKSKASIISQHFLVKLANYLKLRKYILHGKSVDLSGGRGKFSILADCMEACLGAIYLDGGLYPCKKLLNRIINSEMKNDSIEQEWKVCDYKTQLQEKTQKEYNCLPIYQIYKEEGLEHQKVFYVKVCVHNRMLGSGKGKNKKEAEQNAAFYALQKFFSK